MSGLHIFAVEGMPEIKEGDRLADLIAERASLENGDVIVVASKVVAKAENRVVTTDRADSDARQALIRSESVRVLRQRGDLLITETPHGFICANAGIDWSNVEPGHAVALPREPDRSARKLRDRLRALASAETAVIVSDTFGRPWRNGVTDVALGCSGIKPVLDLRGERDQFGNKLHTTQLCIVDEIAGAAELVMGKIRQLPVAIVRGIDPDWLGDDTSVRDAVIRNPPTTYSAEPAGEQP